MEPQGHPKCQRDTTNPRQTCTITCVAPRNTPSDTRPHSTLTVQCKCDSLNTVHYFRGLALSLSHYIHQYFSHKRHRKKSQDIACTRPSHFGTLRLLARTRLPSSLLAFVVTSLELCSPPGWPQHTQPKIYIRGHVVFSLCETLVPHLCCNDARRQPTSTLIEYTKT